MFGAGSGPIALSHLQCIGTESRLIDCSTSVGRSCSHSEDAGARCRFHTGEPQQYRIPTSLNIVHISLGCSDGDIRLISISSPLAGRVEVCYDGVWGTVCSRGWDEADATVACRQLGYSSSGNKWEFFIA